MKKTYKKALMGTFALATAFSLVACGGASSSAPKNTQLVVDSSKFNGDFLNVGFSNTSYDVQVADLLYATQTVSQDGKGQFKINKGIVTNTDYQKSTDADGNTVVTWNLRKDLKWSNGKSITAKDYAFYSLLLYSQAWAELGASVPTPESLLGAEEYSEGKTETIKGFKIIDDYTFSVTIPKDKFPYFFEQDYFGVAALPISLVEGADVQSSDDGVKVTGVDIKTVAAKVKASEIDTKKPTITYGPYMMDKSSDTEVVLKKYADYQGNYEEAKPSIETIVIKANANSELAVQRLKAGEVDFVPTLVSATLIKDAQASSDTIATSTYPRNGYGYLGMANQYGPTKDVHVRRAIAHLTNRNKLVTDVLGGFGQIVNGEYGLAQWMYIEKEADLNSKLNAYSYDIAAANKELDQSDYRFEADGVTPFDSSKASESYLRYNANKEVLELNHFGTENNDISTTLKTGFTNDGPKVGMKYTMDTGDFPTLIGNIKKTTAQSADQKYHLYNLATNFVGSIVDPYRSGVHSRNIGKTANQYNVKDDQLDKLSEELRAIDPSDTTAFANKWFEYQVRYNEIMPVLPLYSNTYYNAFNKDKVANDPTTGIRSWSKMVEYFKLK